MRTIGTVLLVCTCLWNIGGSEGASHYKDGEKVNHPQNLECGELLCCTGDDVCE